MTNAAVAAIQYSLYLRDDLTFLRLWNEGEFNTIRKEWPDAPDDIYIGADPLHVERSSSPDVQSTSDYALSSDNALTPTSEGSVKAFYQSLVSQIPTITYNARAKAGIAITPSIRELLIEHCSNEPEFNKVMGRLYVVSHQDMKKHSIRSW